MHLVRLVRHLSQVPRLKRKKQIVRNQEQYIPDFLQVNLNGLPDISTGALPFLEVCLDLGKRKVGIRPGSDEK